MACQLTPTGRLELLTQEEASHPRAESFPQSLRPDTQKGGAAEDPDMSRTRCLGNAHTPGRIRRYPDSPGCLKPPNSPRARPVKEFSGLPQTNCKRYRKNCLLGHRLVNTPPLSWHSLLSESGAPLCQAGRPTMLEN